MPVSRDDAARLVREAVEAGACDLLFEHGGDMSLSIASNRQRAVLILFGREGFDEGVIAVDDKADGTERVEVVAGGQLGLYSMRETVPVDDAIEAVGYVIEHGRPSPGLRWEAWA